MGKNAGKDGLKAISQKHDGKTLSIEPCCGMLESGFASKYFRLRSGGVNCVYHSELKGSVTSPDEYIEYCPYCGKKFEVVEQ